MSRGAPRLPSGGLRSVNQDANARRARATCGASGRGIRCSTSCRHGHGCSPTTCHVTAVGSHVGSHVGSQATRHQQTLTDADRTFSQFTDSCRRRSTPSGCLRIRRLGIRVPPSAPRESRFVPESSHDGRPQDTSAWKPAALRAVYESLDQSSDIPRLMRSESREQQYLGDSLDMGRHW